VITDPPPAERGALLGLRRDAQRHLAARASCTLSVYPGPAATTRPLAELVPLVPMAETAPMWPFFRVVESAHGEGASALVDHTWRPLHITDEDFGD
jgi:hypothetical protein